MINLISKLAAILLAILVLTTACANGGSNTPIIDASAEQLDVRIQILDIDPSYKDVPVTMQYLQNGMIVQFGNNARVYCEGIELKFNGLAYAGRVPRRPIGLEYGCIYLHSSIRYVGVMSQKYPTITSPTANSTVMRTNNFTIVYAAEASAGVRGSASDGTTAAFGNPNLQADDGTFDGIDISSLKSGPGSISLTREYQGVISNTNFKSIEYVYDAATEITVTWN